MILLLACFAGIIFGASGNSQSSGLKASTLLIFDLHYMHFLSDYFGCQWKEKGGFDSETCKGPKWGTINYREYSKAREMAKKLFDLEDKR